MLMHLGRESSPRSSRFRPLDWRVFSDSAYFINSIGLRPTVDLFSAHVEDSTSTGASRWGKHRLCCGFAALIGLTRCPQLTHARGERAARSWVRIRRQSVIVAGSWSEETLEVATRVLIAGGGVAALEAALALRALAEDRVSVELLAPEPQFWYRPLAVAEPFGLGEVRHFDLAELAAAASAGFSPGAVAGVEVGARRVQTSAGSSIAYDVLLVACGAVPSPAIAGALTFRGPADSERFRQLLEEIDAGEVRRIAFVVPWGAAWSLPIYELALMTAVYLGERDLDGVELTLVTPEDEPLQLFGPAGSEAVRGLLEERGIAVQTGACAVELVDAELLFVPEGRIVTDRVVALPRLRGPRIDGLPQTVEGFLPVDAHGQVHGLDDVFAAGDITSFPVKQGGIAAQQADAAAELIAAEAGADLTPQPFRPVLRGLLLTGRQPAYLRHELTGGAGDTSAASPDPLWWPPAKIVGRYLASFLGSFAGVEPPPEAPAAQGALSVEVELEPERVERLATLQPELEREAEGEEVPRVGEVMATDPLVVAPEDTLGELAEKMRERDVGSALVADYGRLIGILTARDLLRAFAGRVHPSEARAREWMTAEPVAVSAATPIDVAVTLMTEYGFHHLPVVEDERPIGLVGLRQAARRTRTRTGIGLGF
jgi:sulfide:quinone oxidoreductase